MKEWIVDKAGQGDFTTVGEALASAEAWIADGGERPGEGARILIRAGVYREKLRIEVPAIELSGEGSEATIIAWDDCAPRLLPDGSRMGTFNSYTLYVSAPRVTLRGLSVVNSAGDGRLAGQAVALYADADLFLAEGCRLSARQDTLCTGPLPRNPLPRGVNLVHPVAGLGDREPELPFRQLYRRCLIEGDVDFIFGSAMALFEDCEIRSLARLPLARPPESASAGPGSLASAALDPDGAAQGWIAAPSTYPGQAAGFVFSRCRLTAGEGTDRVYLGRPWRYTGRAVFAGCEIGAHILPAGWDDWGKPEARAFGGFAEYGSRGPGAPRQPGSPAGQAGAEGFRVPWAKTMPDYPDEASAGAEDFSAEALFGLAFAGR